MTVEIKVPTLGESVTEATIAKWFKQPGDAVAKDEAVCELETDKVTIEVNAPTAGALKEIIAAEGSDVGVGALLATLDEGAEGAAASPPPAAEKPAAAPEAAPAAPPPPPPAAAPPPPLVAAPTAAPVQASRPPLSPAVRKLVDDNDLDPTQIAGTGPDGRLSKGDVMKAIENGTGKRRAAASAAAAPAKGFTPTADLPPRPENPREEKVRMTKLRKVIAGRLKQAQNTAAMLTTWNEIDMGAAMDLRATYKDQFEKKHGIRLGFMSFFVRAACIALKEWPAVNAEIYGEDLIYKNYYNIGVAVGTPAGLGGAGS